MNILLTNDDGIFGLGLAALYRALSRLGKVWVVAPAVEQSGVSQALTFARQFWLKTFLSTVNAGAGEWKERRQTA